MHFVFYDKMYSLIDVRAQREFAYEIPGAHSSVSMALFRMRNGLPLYAR